MHGNGLASYSWLVTYVRTCIHSYESHDRHLLKDSMTEVEIGGVTGVLATMCSYIRS